MIIIDKLLYIYVYLSLLPISKWPSLDVIEFSGKKNPPRKKNPTWMHHLFFPLRRRIILITS
jgi:hypothetical protein